MAREMKDSGIPWIGEIPADWNLIATKRLYKIESGATPKSENSNYYDGSIPWITPADFKTNDVFVSCGRRNITELGLNSCGTILIPAKSIIFSKRAPIGAVVINKVDLCTNQGCLSCIPKVDLEVKYFYYAMSIFTEQYNLLGTGTTFKEISTTDFANFVLPYPSLYQQQKIARYLDKSCARIDAVLNKTRISIEEYKKLKQAIITQAVTKGVRGDRPMRESGIECIPMIPADWSSFRGKHLFYETNERSETGSEELLTVSHKTGITPRSQKNVNMFMSESLIGYKVCHEGDIAANTMWMWQGAIGVSAYHGIISPSYNTYRQRNSAFDPQYLDYLLRVRPLVGMYNACSTGITASRLRLYPEQFLSFNFPVPSMEEQQEIVNYLGDKVGKMNTLIQKKEQYLTELETYKKSLIYEYVIGKKEVKK